MNVCAAGISDNFANLLPFHTKSLSPSASSVLEPILIVESSIKTSVQRLVADPKLCNASVAGTKFHPASSVNVDVSLFDVRPSIFASPPILTRSTVFPLEIDSSVPSNARDCGTLSPPLPPLPPVGGEETHALPLYVSTSPTSPLTVRLSDRIAVPWNLSPYISLNRRSALPISHSLSTDGALCPSNLI